MAASSGISRWPIMLISSILYGRILGQSLFFLTMTTILRLLIGFPFCLSYCPCPPQGEY